MNEERHPVRKCRKILSGRRAKEASALDPTRWVPFGSDREGVVGSLSQPKGREGFGDQQGAQPRLCVWRRGWVGREG